MISKIQETFKVKKFVIASVLNWIDEERNKETYGSLSLISSDDSRVKVFVIPTNEELVIARETVDVLKSNNL